MTYSISPTGLDFNFAAAHDAADEERISRNWSSVEELAIYDPFGVDLVAPEATDENNLDYEDNVALELIKLDTTGIVDLDSEDNQYRDFDPYYWDYNNDPYFWDYRREDDRPAIALMDDVRIVFEDSHDYASDNELRPLDRFGYEPVTLMPSFSSNKGQERPLNWWGDESQYRWNKYPWGCHNCGRKFAKWRDENGRKLRKSSREDRHGLRQTSFEVRHRHSDWYEEIQSWLNPNIDLRPDYLTESCREYADGRWNVILLDNYREQNLHEIKVYDRELESAWYGLMLNPIDDELLRFAA